MRLGTCQEYVGSSPWVSGACQDGAREFGRRRPRLAERLSVVAEKLAESWEGLDDADGARLEFVRRFVEGFGKLARNMPRDHRRKTVRLTAVKSRGYRIAGVRS
ncbi:hypothetical protein BHE74_00019445 [Ensete ventricosum]|nr:hypothetical protein GW17_00047490 [Ensete ventricosum]RWW72729.1 hypothetical protein BHE74_00019445 [Ensete ventricosum]RZS00744.1 hypothetical protein BHM03_00030511 [Ensete ventricosum]